MRAELARARAERQPYAIEHRIVTRDGRIRHVFESGRFHFEEGTARPRRVIGVMLDITDRKIAEERLRHLAEHDALTQLPNRTLSSTRLIAAIERASRATHQVGVFFIDVDRFKAVNDSMEPHGGRSPSTRARFASAGFRRGARHRGPARRRRVYRRDRQDRA